jgi:putative ATP-dependent endonuclease of the OLD family
VGVGGDGNYLPFLRVAASMAIPWFIFSDGEPEAVAAVTKALSAVGSTLPDNRVTVLPSGRNFERYLIDENYRDDLKRGILAFLEPTFADARYKQAKEQEVAGWTDEELLKYLAAWKTKLSPHWAAAIASRLDARRIPPAIREILERLDGVLKPVQEVSYEG